MKKFNLNRKLFGLRFILGALEGLCRTNVGPFWVYVGPMLCHLVGFMGFHGGLWVKKGPMWGSMEVSRMKKFNLN